MTWGIIAFVVIDAVVFGAILYYVIRKRRDLRQRGFDVMPPKQ